MASYLFVHQNFPGQFPHLAKALAERGDAVVAIGEAKRLKQRQPPHPDIQTVGYPTPKGASAQTHHYVQGLEAHVRRGQTVLRSALELARKGLKPDVVIGHPGWGETLFLRDVFPRARHIQYLEYFYRAQEGDVGFDPEFPATLDDRCRVRVKNASQLLSFEAADGGISPTAWQKTRYPTDWQSRITQLHDGIDTAKVHPDPDASFTVKTDSVFGEGSQRTLTRADEVLTYVARNLEPYRGFQTFMRAAPAILEQRPDVQILVVGGDNVSYGRSLTNGLSYREHYQEGWDNNVDRSRIHFLGRLSYADYLRVLQISSLHLYLTYPFTLSWSMLEAMSAGCVLLGSDTAPVREVIRNGENGFLTDFFDHQRLAKRSADLLAFRQEHNEIRIAARETVLERYDLYGKCLPLLLDYIG